MTEEIERFFARRPALRVQYEHEGSFRDYCRRYYHRIPLGRGARLTNLIVEYAKTQVSIPVDERLLRAQLNQYPLVSTADHGGIIHQNILYNANLLFSGMLDLQSLPYQVVLATTRIPLNNASHPRGIVFQGTKLNFFPSSQRHTPVWMLEDGITPDQCRGLPTLFQPEGLTGLTSSQREFLEFTLLECAGLPKIAQTFSVFHEQLPAINHALWQHYFAKQYRGSRPALLSFPLEHFVRELLLEDLEDSSSLLFRILFEPRVRGVYLEEFAGISGCWSPGSGTQFFWGTNDQRRFVALRVDAEAGCLRTVDPQATWEPIPLTPPSIAEAVRSKRLVPSAFLEMFLVGFLEGYTLMGGFNQVTYMAWMRVAHERSMLRLDEWPRAAWFARTLTDGLVCGPLPFPQWSSSFDLLWNFNSTDGRFHGNLHGGLDRQALETMMDTSLKTLLQNGVEAMLHVVD